MENITIRKKTTPVLESLKSHKVFSDPVLAVQTAKTMSKTAPEIRLYETPSKKYIVTSDKMKFKELDFLRMNLQHLRDSDDYGDLYDSRWISKAMREQHA